MPDFTVIWQLFSVLSAVRDHDLAFSNYIALPYHSNTLFSADCGGKHEFGAGGEGGLDSGDSKVVYNKVLTFSVYNQ